MSLPLHLVLVRHGQSEGNAANQASRSGDHSHFTDSFRSRSSAWWHLTELGREQAQIAGAWIREEMPEVNFDRFLASTFPRAMETAALLGIPNAGWLLRTELREREIGQLEGLTVEERDRLWATELAARPGAPFYWRPPNGESLADVALRLRSVLDNLHRKSDSGAILVCHGEVMSTLHRMLTRMTDAEFSTMPESSIWNCEIFHYTRIHPVDSRVTPSMSWWRRITPTDPGLRDGKWHPIVHPRYSNQELLEAAALAGPVRGSFTRLPDFSDPGGPTSSLG